MNGHHIKLAQNAEEFCPWDENFEAEFQSADAKFPFVLDWIETLDRCGPPFDAPIVKRITPIDVTADQTGDLLECAISLAVRSPRYRETAVALAEEMRGPIPKRERNALIGANIRFAQRNAVRNIRLGGKAMLIFSPEREFIFGDGFFHNLPIQGEHWHHPKIFAPLTPSMAVLFVRPTQYRQLPRLVTLMASPEEVDELNFSTRVYARNALFYRTEKPNVGEEFTCAKHQVFADHRHAINELCYKIPGVPPKDPQLDSVMDFMALHALK